MEGLKNWKYNLKEGVDYLHTRYNIATKKYNGDDLIKATYYGYNHGNIKHYNKRDKTALKVLGFYTNKSWNKK